MKNALVIDITEARYPERDGCTQKKRSGYEKCLKSHLGFVPGASRDLHP